MDSGGERVSNTRGDEAAADFHPLDRFNAFSDGVFAVVMLRALFLGAAFTIQSLLLELGL